MYRQESSPRHRANRRSQQVAIYVGLTLLTVSSAAFFGFLGVCIGLMSNLPSTELIGRSESSSPVRILGRDYSGAEILLAEIMPPVQAAPATIADIPPLLQQAVCAAADEHFLDRKPSGLGSLMRALLTELTRRQTGPDISPLASRIINSTSAVREAKRPNLFRAALAYRMEREWSKERIVATFLNSSYFGDGCFGISVAARHYFDKHPADLSLSEAAVLAAMGASEGFLSSGYSPDSLVWARDRVLNTMFQHNWIDGPTLQKTLADPISMREHPENSVVRVPTFASLVEQQLVRRYGAARVERGGIVVHTSLDLKVQEAAELALASVLAQPGDPQGVLIAVDLETASLLAMAQTASDEYADLVTSPRDIDCLLGPLAVVTALAKGLNPFTTYAGDEHGYILAGPGIMCDRKALAALLKQLGSDTVIDSAAKIGLPLRIEPPMTETERQLPRSLLAPLEVAGLFAVLGTQGLVPTGTQSDSLIRSILDRSIVRVESDEQDVFDLTVPAWDKRWPAAASFLVTQALSEMYAITSEINVPQRNVACMQASSPYSGDSWFVGYTRSLLAVVWVGNPSAQRRSSASQEELSRSSDAPDAAAKAREIWNRFMGEVVTIEQSDPFMPPVEDDWTAVAVEEEIGIHEKSTRKRVCTLLVPTWAVAESPVRAATTAIQAGASTSMQQPTSSLTTGATLSDTTVPNFLGLPLVEARVAAEKAGLALRVTVGAAESHPGCVSAQHPAPGTRVPKKSTVDVVVEALPPTAPPETTHPKD